MKLKRIILPALLAIGLSGQAAAGPVMTDLTSADYITIGALDWAWAAPITSENWYGTNTLYQASLHAGWREASDLEWATHPDYPDFGGKCAAKFWNSNFTHCDFGDPLSQHWSNGSENYYDLLYVRSARDDGHVPEPGSLALFGFALLLPLMARRRVRSR